MRNFLLIVIILCSFPAWAEKDKSTRCTLKNTEFCGTWYDRQGFKAIITGDRLVYGDDIPCMVMKEGEFEDGRPFSLLKCIEMPDPNAPHGPDSPYPVGYLFTYYPMKDWRKDQKNGSVQKYKYYRLVSSNLCFSDHPDDRKSCDISTLMAPDTWSSRGPIYKPRKD